MNYAKAVKTMRKKGFDHKKEKEGFKKCTLCGTYILNENAVYHCEKCDNKLKSAIKSRKPKIKIYY